MIVMIFLFFILFNFPPFYIGQALTPSTLYIGYLSTSDLN
jgi:hypothetical protein